MIRLIASDMDGTLLDSKKNMPADILHVVRALRGMGVQFVIASGRQYAALRRDLGELADEVIFLAENGALVMENDQQLFIDPLPADIIRPIIERTRDMAGVHPVICRAGAALIEKSAPEEFIRNVNLYYDSTEIVDNLLDVCDGLEDVCKVAFYDEGDAEHHEYPLLREILPDSLAVILSGYSWVDVMKPGANKGRAMRMLQRIKGIGPDQCMAFGDYLNDLEMLGSVTESYAMKNALPEIRAAAKYIAPGNDENGVVRVIRERFHI